MLGWIGLDLNHDGFVDLVDITLWLAGIAAVTAAIHRTWTWGKAVRTKTRDKIAHTVVTAVQKELQPLRTDISDLHGRLSTHLVEEAKEIRKIREDQAAIREASEDRMAAVHVMRTDVDTLMAGQQDIINAINIKGDEILEQERANQ